MEQNEIDLCGYTHGRHGWPTSESAELAELRSLVSGGSRLVTIAGPGGIGKSRLALQVAAEVLDGTGGGGWSSWRRWPNPSW